MAVSHRQAVLARIGISLKIAAHSAVESLRHGRVEPAGCLESLEDGPHGGIEDKARCV